jgi:CRISPR-associated protein Cas8b/Csh1 subtype I-B
MTAEYINLLEEYREFLPDEIVSLNDVSAVLGAVSIVKESVDTGVPVETILSTNNNIQKEAVGDDSTELCIVEFETVMENGEKHLEFTGVRSRPVLETDIVDYPYYQKNQGASKSLTQRSNDKKPDKFFKLNSWGVFYPLFDSWCELSSDMDSHPWWIDALQEIGETAEVEYPDHPTVKQPTMYQQMEQAVRDELFTDTESFDGFVSIEINGQPPSELSEYQSVMDHIVKKNLIEMNGNQSVGEGVGLVSNTVGEVTGVSDSMWTDYNSSKQLEEQPYLSGEDAWRHRPLRLTTAQFMDRGANIIEDLYAYLSFGDNQYSLNYYVIPSLYGSYSFEEAVNWYDMVEMIGDEHRASSTVLKASIGLIDDDVDEVDLLGGESSGFTADVAFVSLQEEGNKNKELLHDVVFTDRIEKVTETITAVADSVVSRYPLRNPESEYEDIFTAGVRGDMLAGTVFNPKWFAEKLCGTEYSVPSSNSIEHQVSQSLLFNEDISVPELLQSFVERLIYIETDIESLVNKGNEYYSFVKTIGRQQLVLQTLDQLGLCNASVPKTESFNNSSYLDIHMSDSECNIQGDGVIPFYLGRIVGGLSYTQQSKYSVSSPAFSQYSIDYVSQQNFQKVYQEVVTKVLQYTNKSGSTSQLEEYMEMKELADALQKKPSDWDITDSEFKYYYALGVTDGFTYTEPEE